MSELEYNITPAGGNAGVVLAVHLTATDADAVKQAGNPVVDFGGPVTATIGITPVTVVLPTNMVHVVNGVRVSYVFKTQANIADNIAMAQAWVAQATARVLNGLVAKRVEKTAIAGALSGINSV